MANIKGTGSPTRETLGAVGDIYIDITNGKRYKCTFAYRSTTGGSFDCSWTELKTNKVKKEEINKVQKEEINNVQIAVKEELKVQKPESEYEMKEEEITASPKRKDYSAYSKKNR